MIRVKTYFFDQLHAVTSRIPAKFLIPCGDWNGHVVRAGTGYRGVHGGLVYCRPEPDVAGRRTLEYALAFDLLLGNICFKKPDSHLITYKSGNIGTLTDFFLFRWTMRKLVRCKNDPWRKDSPVTPASCMLLVCDMRTDVPSSESSSLASKFGSVKTLR